MRPKNDWSILAPPGPPHFTHLIEAAVSRRGFLAGGAGALGLMLLGRAGAAATPLLGFEALLPSDADDVRVPAGYTADVLFAWGDPVSDGPPWKADASNTSIEQEQQAGMHHDGMAYFPLDGPGARGLLAINHEYTDEGLLHRDGTASWSAEKVRKSQAAHGVSIIEVALEGGAWRVVRPSSYARRITAFTEMTIAGPARGDKRMQTRADPTGTRVLGTLNNCASGATPWGTYLTCEENWHLYFHHPGVPDEAQKRYGIGTGGGYRWHEHDVRFDVGSEPNECNRFGWVVEIDPRDAKSTPKKRTALGRFRHENAAVTIAKDGRAVVYMGDDAPFEYIYKFVSEETHDKGDVLDRGTLYVARFHEGDAGEWVPLTLDNPDLKGKFESEADVLIHARRAAFEAKGTPMDRPEWIAIHPCTGENFVTLTNNASRGVVGKPPPDGPNPRYANVYGHILRWSETDGDAAAETFRWSVFLLAGNPKHADPARRGTLREDADAFGSPDGLWFDQRGVLWIETDVSAGTLGAHDYKGLGNNQMLAADPGSGEVRRFLTGPKRCEVTGIAAAPDGRTLFVNIQHPGEPDDDTSDPAAPGKHSTWPGGVAVGRPRAATVVVRRTDGGVIGT